MLLFVAVASSAALCVAFVAAGSRAVARAGRAEASVAARHRFVSAFDGAPADRLPAELLVEAFETLAVRLPDDVPLADLRPGARLRADLGLQPADVEDAALLVAARCDCRIPRGRDLDALHREVATVDQFVGYLARFARADRDARAA